MTALTDLTDTVEGEKAIREMARMLVAKGITPEEIGRARRLGGYQGFIKNNDGEFEKHDLYRWEIAPSWDEGPKWELVQPAAAVRIAAAKPKARPADRRTVIFPDPQIGFRRMADGTMVEMHDWSAMRAGLGVARAAGCEVAVNLGDTLDFAEWSEKFAVLPEFVQTTQPALDDAHRFLAEQHSFIDDVKLLEGNHDARLGNLVARNAKAALRLRPAATPPDHWPVLSVQSLLRLDDIEVDYVDGYPAGRIKLTAGNDTLAPLYAIHGEKLDVAKVAKAERQSFVQGHIHRIALHSETYEVDGRPVTIIAFSPGCLCRTDGSVPSTRGGTDSRGVPIVRWESWQQGVAIVSEWDDGTWVPELVPIHDGRALWRGSVYET